MKQKSEFKKIWEDFPGYRYMHMGVSEFPVIRQHQGNGWTLIGWIDGTRIMSYKSIRTDGMFGRAFTNEEHEIVNCATTDDAIKFAKEYFKVKGVM